MRVRWSDLSIAARLLACGAMSLVLAPCVAAQTQPPSSVEASSEIRILFDIPAGPLDSALRRYSILTGRQLLFESRLVAGYHAAALRGLATADEALDELLAETGLQVDSVDARTGVLSVTALDLMPAAPSATPPSADNRVLETRSVGWLTLARTEASAVPAEVIVVTGSRFARSDLTAVTPVFVLGRAEIESSGAYEMGALLAAQSPATLEFSGQSTHLSAQNAGLTSVGLRGLGTTRTLVLIDGRRTVSNSGNGSRFGSDSIPVEFVEQVEVTTGGASALYGSDAIAGVVNFVLRDDLDGGSAVFQSGLTEDGGGSFSGGAFTVGRPFAAGRGHVIANLTLDQLARIGADERDWALSDAALSNDGTRLEDDRSSYTPGGRFIGYDFWFDETGLQRDFDPDIDNVSTRPEATVSLPRERQMLALKARYDLTDQIELFATALVSRSQSRATREAQTAYYGQDFGAAREDIGRIALDNPFVPDDIRAAALADGLSGITWRRRFTELGPEYRDIDRVTDRFWAGLSGQAAGWDWEAYAGHGRYAQIQLRSGELNFSHIQAALNVEPAAGTPSGYRCRDAAARQGGCVPLDIFGVNSITAEAADYIRATDRLDVDVRQDTIGLTLTGEAVFPGLGRIPLALGIEHRRDQQQTVGDPITQSRDTGYVDVPDLDASVDATEAFFETSVTLLSGRPMIQHLGVEFAGRLARYDIDSVGGVGSFRLGASWVVSPGLQLRAQFANAQRAPGMVELYSAPRGDYDSVSDPCDGVTLASGGIVAGNCRADDRIAAVIAQNGVFTQSVSSVYAPNSGNPDLTEEDSRSWNLGFVFTPRQRPGFSLMLDAYDIRVEGVIASLASQSLLQECYGAATQLAANTFCDSIERSDSGQLSAMLNQTDNLHALRSSGVDVRLRDGWRVGDGWLRGDWKAQLLYAYSHRLQQEFARSDGSVQINHWRGEVGAPAHRWTGSLSWEADAWQVQWRVRYEGASLDSHDRAALDDAAAQLFLAVDPWLQHDVSARIELRDGWRLFGGVNNIFHDYGPFLPSGTQSGDRRNFNPAYDVVGRSVYLGLRRHW
ncbi:TonB-dependent receptor domain-containing protein [Maricaulis sp.]|uniref:TonB-dependent receptor domain-containing protein n=1 Tax=Maricaulis sp. TaxID=1486257 RepID=UPI003A8D52A9